MKLSSKYKNEIAKYKLNNNVIFQYFGEEIIDTIFATVPDVDTLNTKVVNKEIEHFLNEKEVNFFEQQYIILDKTSEKVNISKTFSIPTELKGKIGEMEDKVLDFIYDGGHRLLITGKKGWGKTTFLRYISRYVLPKLNQYKDSKNNSFNKPCVPIDISFNAKINSFNSANEKEYHKLFYKEIIDKISSCCYDYLNDDIRSAFYQFLLEQPTFREYKVEYDRIIRHHKEARIPAKERDEKLDDLKTDIERNDETILNCFKYLNLDSKCPAIPLIIFDDLDPLNISVQTYIFTEIYKLAHTYKIKTIISMRPRSHKIVSGRVAEAIQISNSLMFTDSFTDNYLEGKLTKISKNITKIIPKQEGVNIGKNLILKPLNAEIFFNNFIDISMNKDVKYSLKNLSGGNLRKLNEFIKVYLKSGYIDASPKVFKNLIDKQIISNTDSNMPIGIVYSALFTNNYQTVFGIANNEIDNYVINILCNGTSSVNTYLIRLHLLSLFYRNGRATNTLPIIIDKYKNIINGNTDEIQNDIARVIKRFNNYNLIGNNTTLEIPEASVPDKIFNQINDSDEFYLEELGCYYYDTIISIFEYFYFMKDDIFFKNDMGILSCIETQTNMILRFEQVIKYFEILFQEEISFYNGLDTAQKKYYKNNFAPFYNDDKIFYVQVFVDKMREYARTRTYDNIDSISKKLNELINRINDEIQKIDSEEN